MEGYGLLNSHGGNGYYGGAGGRIAVYLDTEMYFFGTFEAYGGDSSIHAYLSEGGPGSVYIKDVRCVTFFR